MPNTGFEGGLVGLFGGISQGIKYNEEKKSKSEDLYIRLSADKSLRMKPGKKFKDGMTRVQVMDMFEENPDDTYKAAGQAPVAQSVIDYYSKIFKELKGAKEGDITVKDLELMARAKGIDLNTEKLAETTTNRIEKYKLEWENLRNKETEQGNEIISKMIDVAIKTDTDFEELISPKSQFRKPVEWMLKRRGININDKPVNTSWQDFLTNLGFERDTKSEVVEETPVVKPTVSQSNPTNQGGVNVVSDDAVKAKARELRQTDKSSTTQQLLDKARNMLSGQTATPGVMETPGMEQQIGQSLQQPIHASPTASPAVTPMTQSSLMQKSILPKQQAQVADPNQHVLQLAREFRDKLANSPYQVNRKNSMVGIRG